MSEDRSDLAKKLAPEYASRWYATANRMAPVIASMEPDTLEEFNKMLAIMRPALDKAVPDVANMTNIQRTIRQLSQMYEAASVMTAYYTDFWDRMAAFFDELAVVQQAYPEKFNDKKGEHK